MGGERVTGNRIRIADDPHARERAGSPGTWVSPSWRVAIADALADDLGLGVDLAARGAPGMAGMLASTISLVTS